MNPQASYSTGLPAAPRPRKRRRVFLWIFLAVQVLFIIWLISAGLTGDHQTTHCTAAGLTSGECKATSEVGTGLAIGFILVFWVIIDLLVSIPYLIYRLARRPAR
jgi:hypothetical protein